MIKDGKDYTIFARPIYELPELDRDTAPDVFSTVAIRAVTEKEYGMADPEGEGEFIGKATVYHINFTQYGQDIAQDANYRPEAVEEVLEKCCDGDLHIHVDFINMKPGWVDTDADLIAVRGLFLLAGDTASVSVAPWPDETDPTPEQIARWARIGLKTNIGGVLYAMSNAEREQNME